MMQVANNVLTLREMASLKVAEEPRLMGPMSIANSNVMTTAWRGVVLFDWTCAISIRTWSYSIPE